MCNVGLGFKKFGGFGDFRGSGFGRFVLLVSSLRKAKLATHEGRRHPYKIPLLARSTLQII